jgi:hypothetical protein
MTTHITTIAPFGDSDSGYVEAVCLCGWHIRHIFGVAVEVAARKHEEKGAGRGA